VSSANQFPVDALYPYPISRVGIYENFRAMRINQLLSEASGIDANFMKKMQLDNYNELAAMALPTMLRVLDKTKLDKEELEVVRSLASWNCFNNATEKAPVFFEEWSVEFYNALWDEMLDPSLPMKKPNLYFTAEFIQKDSSSSFYDNLQTGEHETRESLLLISFDKAVQKLKEKNGSLENVKDWGTYKATMVHHLSPALDAFSSMNVYCGGNRGIINATNATHGPSWRMIVDLGDMKGYCVYPGGQSGNPGSKFYDSMIEKWAKGEYYEAHFAKDEKQYVTGKLFSITANSKP
jgi:penicillin amidase